MTHPSDPKTQDEYNALFMNNSRVEGFGIENVTQVSACPFCAAPDWGKWRIMRVEEDMQANRKCSACGRSGKFLFHDLGNGQKQFELVQTGGAPIADYLPVIRRIDN